MADRDRPHTDNSETVGPAQPRAAVAAVSRPGQGALYRTWFRRRFFGGLDPSDVERFIAETEARYRDEIKSWQERLKEAEARISELQEEVQALVRERDAARTEAQRCREMQESITTVLLRAQEEAEQIRQEAREAWQALLNEKEAIQRTSLEALQHIIEQGEAELDELRRRWRHYLDSIRRTMDHASQALEPGTPAKGQPSHASFRTGPPDDPRTTEASSDSIGGQTPQRDEDCDPQEPQEPQERPLLPNYSPSWRGDRADISVYVSNPSIDGNEFEWWYRLQEEIKEIPGVTRVDFTFDTRQSGLLQVWTFQPEPVLHHLVNKPGLQIKRTKS